MGPSRMPALLRCAALVCGLCASTALGRAQSLDPQGPEQGGTELQVWSGAGHSVKGGTNKIAVWNAGIRYGWVFTRPHGPGILRGQFEYAIDWVPLNLIFQPHSVAYGAGFNPFALKWLSVPRHGVTPYIDLGGGVLYTSREVPAGISNINFASGSGVGVNIGRGKAHWSLELRWMHISDAGLTEVNPGINTVQVRAGLGWFRHRE